MALTHRVATVDRGTKEFAAAAFRGERADGVERPMRTGMGGHAGETGGPNGDRQGTASMEAL